jgi:hypothetical protein
MMRRRDEAKKESINYDEALFHNANHPPLVTDQGSQSDSVIVGRLSICQWSPSWIFDSDSIELESDRCGSWG